MAKKSKSTAVASKDVPAVFETSGKKSKKDKAKTQVALFDPGALLDELQDQTERKYGLSSTTLDRDEARLSTGLSALDLLLMGGIVGGGWYTVYGGEQSAKSTLTMQLLSMITNEVERRGRKIASSIFDYEGSSDPDYIGNIMRTLGLRGDPSTIFGIKDDDTGEWLVRPTIRYYAHDVGDDFFKYIGKLKRGLPDLEKHGKEYYYVFEHTKENKSKLAGLYDTKYLTRYNKIRVPAPDGFMQAVTIVDSYPAMLPDGLDDDDRNEAMAEQARMFSTGIRKIRGGMRKKRMTVIGVNQLRERPATMFGNPEYEPCGQALKFYSDVRIKSTSRASVPYGGFKLDKGICEEASVDVEGGKDIYRFVCLKTTKNKLGGIPNREIWARIWVSDANGQARGFDPVFDTFEYLKQLGLVSGTMANLKFDKATPLGNAKKITWLDFKLLVLGSKKEITEVCKRAGIKPGSIRSWVKKHCAKGDGPRLYKERIVSGKTAEDDSDE